MARRWRSRGLVAIGVVVILGVAAITLRSMLPAPGPSAGTSGPRCSPKPCTELDGWELYVTRVERPAGRVTMDVSFRNNTRGGGFEAVSYRHTSIQDFVLVTASGAKVQPSTGAGCPGWEEARIERGGSAGPDHLCFDVAETTVSGAELTWSPDTGPFGAAGSVPLP